MKEEVLVKICGVRAVDAALAALRAGADFLGLNFVPDSKRRVEVPRAREIIRAVRKAGDIKIVGVFRDAPVSTVNELCRTLDLDFVQLHGKETNAYMRKVEKPVIKSITSSDKLKKNTARFFLLDRTEQGKGEMVDPQLAETLARKTNLFLAGGLTPENVAEAILRVKPFGVDVASGIETRGTQDTNKIKAFVMNAKTICV